MNKTGCFLVCLVLVALTLPAQTNPGAAGSRPGGGTGGRSGTGQLTEERPGERDTNIAIASIQEKQVRSSVAGRLKPLHAIVHTAPSTGTITGIHVVVGQKVHKGSPLFTIARDSSTGTYAPVIIRARIDGIVSTLNASLYNEIRSGDAGATVIDSSHLQLEAFLSDKDVHALTPGMLVEAADSRGQKVFGRLVSISPEPDYQTGLYQLHFEFTLDQQEQSQRWTGQFVRVDIPVETVSGIFIPQDLLVRRYGQYYLWVVTDDNTLQLQRIQTGISIDDSILVSSGIREGARYLRQISGRETEGMRLQQPQTE